jgi:hypothetical protein
MKAYFQIQDGLPLNTDIMSAIEGFQNLCYDIKLYNIVDVMSGKMDNLAKEHTFVGGLDCMSLLFKKIGKYPTPIDFPDEITKLVNRKIQVLNIDDVIEKFKKDLIPVFVKPVKTKLFDGILLEKLEYLNYFRGFEGIDVITSPKMNILSEYRVYIHKGKIVYSANYSGDFTLIPNYDYVQQIIYAYKSAPVAYTIDIAIVNNDGYIYNDIVEVNDFWSIGNYGLKCWDYAQMLIDRYNEILK